ncbi:hypothetical protein HYX07_01155 [Candidatus Woesearchaeota archaeon]|nr:hypothetical protein [Candidatus Woesearchaeota archaeon]
MMRYISIVLLTALVIGCTAEQEQIYREKYEPIFKNETQKIVQNTTQQIVENLTKQNEELKQQLENTSQAIQDINKKLSSSESKGDGGEGGGIGNNSQNENNTQAPVKEYFKRLAED